MTTRHRGRHSLWLAAWLLAVSGTSAFSQATAPGPAAAPRPGEVEMAPISCWWRADRSAVRVGERFTLVLTCGVVESGTTRVVPNVNQLEAGALSITPFDAVSGVRGEDVVVPPRRFFQFEYTVRLLGDGFFGKDVEVPPLRITYNIEAPGGTTQGRDRTYVLPALPMRVLSIVPDSANDIRDSSGLTFAGIEARRFRASAARVAGFILFAFAAVLVAMGLAGLLRERGVVRGTAVKLVSPSSVLAGCLRTLSEVKEEAARGGWTPELAHRALGALRIGGSHALGKPVAQALVDADTEPREGQVVVRTGWIRRRRALVSGAATPHALGLALEKGPAARRPKARVTIEQLSEALQAFSRASYGRAGMADGSSLDAALEQGAQAIGRLKASVAWPMRAVSAVTRSFAGF